MATLCWNKLNSLRNVVLATIYCVGAALSTASPTQCAGNNDGNYPILAISDHILTVPILRLIWMKNSGIKV